MSRIAYVNGQYVPHALAQVHIEDRGYQFADGVYEVCLVVDGKYWDLDGHLARLKRSLDELQIAMPMSENALRVVMDNVRKRNHLPSAMIYIQVTRGVAPRNHIFPVGLKPSLVMTVKPFDLDQSDAKAAKGIRVITQPDIRWGRTDIKSTGLLANAMAKHAASEVGAGEALLIRDGHITECSSSNAWIIDKDGVLITHPKSHEILSGITRETAKACAQELQLNVVERPFTLDEVKAASEMFLTSASSVVMPVIGVDSFKIGDGTPGPITKRLRESYKARARAL
ncbi:D-amino-acid transaminase [Hyphococcus lacteus]|uniref:Probable branched-chain-amino-acid aminotransferase n=1 Tax=Hyphococcus lacteus TaxID=3143536 RepID=A0ABV3Z8U2_9PROT